MKKVLASIFISLFLLSLTAPGYSGEKAPQKVVDLAKKKLMELSTDTIIVDAVKKENLKGKTLDQIKQMDKKWKATAGIVGYMELMMTSACGKHLQKLVKSAPYYAEIFVMDNQGANVAMSDKTSDYWQGDEAKFKNSYKDGKGDLFIDEVEFDDSTQAYLVQISLPVKDGDKVIGAITIGIDVDKIE